MSNENKKLSDQVKNTLDILSDGKNLWQKQMPDQIMLLSSNKLKMSNQSFNPKLNLSNK